MNMKRDLFWVLLLIIILFGFMLGSRPLSTPDEGRYAEIPREMNVTGDYLTPRLNGVKYFEKPPLMYWMEAGFIKVFGLSEWALRILPFLLGIGGCLWMFTVSRLLIGREEAWASSLILATCSLYYAHTRLLILDLGITVFLSFCLFSFFLATTASSRRTQNLWLLGFYTGSALAVLTKGVVGALIPGALILLWTVPWGRWQELKLAFKPWGIILFFVITSPWHIAVSIINPEFPYFYFIHEHFTRFVALEHGRFQPWWFFIPILLLGLFPWVNFLPQAIYQANSKISKPLLQFLSLWIGFVLIFFSFSNSKLIPYILPLFPPIALIIGAYIGAFWRERKNTLGFVWGVQLFRVICAIMIIALPLVIYAQDLIKKLGELSLLFTLFILVLILGIAIPGFFVNKGRVRETLASIASVSVAMFVLLNAAWGVLEERSIKPLALTFQKIRQPEDVVICYEKYYQDLPVHLNQIVAVAGWRGELDFGMRHEDTSSWMLNHQKFWELWHGKRKVYVFLRKSTFEDLIKKGHPMKLIQETTRDVLVVNK
jgi:4-amino-4-deoxy-L-arabinose transferase-like glycosyltransferase